MPDLAIPAYFFHAEQHAALLAARPELVVLNPDNGPGHSSHVVYRSLARRLNAAGVTVLWYLHLGYGTRPMNDVYRDLAHYAAWYPFAGVMLDEVPSDLRESDGQYVARSLEAARSHGAETIALNPGTAPVHIPFGDFDVLVTFEGSLAAYRSRRVAAALAPDASWRAHTMHPPWREWHLVHGASIDQHAVTADVARGRGADLIYVTEQRLPNPWGQLARNLTDASEHGPPRRSNSSSRDGVGPSPPAA